MPYRRFAIPWLFFAATLAALAGCESKPADANGTTETLADAAASSQAKPKPKLRSGAKTKVLAAAGDSDHDKTFDDLRFDIKVDEPFRREKLTDEIEALDGKPMRIRGFILPTPQTRGIKQFVLVRDNQECCFGPGAALFDCILVDMQPGVTAEYTIRPVAVSGNFQIEEFVMDGRHLAIYHMDADKVK